MHKYRATSQYHQKFFFLKKTAPLSQKVKRHTGPVKYVHGGAAKAGMLRAEVAAKRALAALAPGAAPSTEEMTAVFGAIGGAESWPTQDRPNVTPNGKPVTGFCLGAVYVLGGVGMATSNVSLAFPSVTKCITAWVRGSLPDKEFPFSSIQVRRTSRFLKNPGAR